ncbi:MAG: membrane-bound lytic murein transglycosylase MltF, partial [Pseudomonadota bacterium]|nr:membrane-bound lytic murein transglycosylase MltF [Pseudomonadota bacterium]
PDYRSVRQELVCHRDGPVPKSVKDLPGLRLAVLHESSYEETLYALTAQTPELAWISDAESGIEELFEQVWSRELDCTIADSHIVALNRRYFPELVVPFPVSKEEQLAWIVVPRARALLEPLTRWFAQARKEGVLAAIDSRHFGFVERFDYVDTVAYMDRIQERLPDYERLFRRAAREHDLSWTLLAAMGYQESHWDPHARSPTGVRGLMMLTLATAKEVGVKNRLDPLQSIQGGALYLRRLLDRLPEGLTGEDRLWVAMAAYNVGLGHVYDARTLAQRLGKNPDAWADLKEVLPLLAKKKYYRTVRHGYARGGEPVRYVQRIRNYLDLLERRLADQTPDYQVAGEAF